MFFNYFIYIVNFCAICWIIFNLEEKASKYCIQIISVLWIAFYINPSRHFEKIIVRFHCIKKTHCKYLCSIFCYLCILNGNLIFYLDFLKCFKSVEVFEKKINKMLIKEFIWKLIIILIYHSILIAEKVIKILFNSCSCSNKNNVHCLSYISTFIELK